MREKGENGESYGFIYITINLVNGKQYIGQKKIDKNSKYYLGSGLHLMNAMKKYGRKNFRRTIVDYADNEANLNQLEYEWIKKFDAVNNENFYNMIDGGNVQESLKRKNSIPVICINNQMTFKSIADAALWANCQYKNVKDSFSQRRYKNEDVLIFRPSSMLQKGKKFCSCCGNIFGGKYDTICIKCRDLKKCIDCPDVIKTNSNAKKRCTKCQQEKERERKRNWKKNNTTKKIK